VSELCLIYEADSNQGWWEVVGYELKRSCRVISPNLSVMN
jgi:hypothetical protein